MAAERPAEGRELSVGDSVGGYRLESLLGEGGMGLVFRGRREGDGATVALKVMKAAFAADETHRRRFLHEARAAAEIRHPNLVPIFEAGEVDGRDFLVVALVDGPTLSERIEHHAPLAVEEVVKLATGVAAGLQALHDREIIHRDIKSSNVLLDAGTPMLTDFGLAKGAGYTVLTRPGTVVGTLEYLAPELLRGEPATPASDLYALGCLVYECAAGKTPFGDRSLFEVGIAHLDEEPADPGAGRDDWPQALSTAVLEALKKEPDLRPATTTAYAELLARAAGNA
jgi:serine/threonine-protein kinase